MRGTPSDKKRPLQKERITEKPHDGFLKSKPKSVSDDLAEKKKRLMQKLKNDEDDIIAEKAMKQERKGKDFHFMYKIT